MAAMENKRVSPYGRTQSNSNGQRGEYSLRVVLREIVSQHMRKLRLPQLL